MLWCGGASRHGSLLGKGAVWGVSRTRCEAPHCNWLPCAQDEHGLPLPMIPGNAATPTSLCAIEVR